MSITNNKESECLVGTVGSAVAPSAELLADWIRQLEEKERVAVMKGDWPAARSAAIEKAKLKETQHWAAGSRRGRA